MAKFLLSENGSFHFRPFSKKHNLMLTLGLSIFLLWPAFLNGGPFWFPDTSTYIRGADAAFFTVTGQPSDWSDRIETVKLSNALSDGDPGLLPAPSYAKEKKIVLSGRSIYYGALIFLPINFFGPWAAAFVQSLITAFVIVFSMAIVLRQDVVQEKIRGGQFFTGFIPYAALSIVLILTPLAYYTNMLMPDIFAGLLCLIFSVMIIFWDHMSRNEKATGLLLACTFVTFHTTIMLLAIVVSVVAFMLQKSVRAKARSAILGLCITFSAVLAGVLFTMSVERFAGQKPMSPPFLTARITAAGPGTDFLKKHCKNDISPFAICRHVKELPMDSDKFLWGNDKDGSLFKVLPIAEQRRIASEDKRFYLTVLADSPIKVISSAMLNGLEVLSLFGLENFNYAKRVSVNSQQYPENIWNEIINTRAALNTMPVKIVENGTIVVIAFSMIVLGFMFFEAYRKKMHETSDIIRFSLLICFAVLANAMICGALSKPHSRYQARLIWLLPLAASLTIAVSRRSSTGQKDGQNGVMNNSVVGRGRL